MSPSDDLVLAKSLTLRDLRTRLTITVPEAGALLGIGRHAAYVAARAAAIPTLRLGRRIVVPLGQLATLVGADEADVRSFAALRVSNVRTRSESPASGRAPR